MKFYKCNKWNLKFKEMPQLDYRWELPILIDKNYEVLLGNSLFDKLNGEVIVIVYPYENEGLKSSLYNIELGIVEENSQDRLSKIIIRLRQFFDDVRKPKYEQLSLFSYKDVSLISEDNYILQENSFIKDNHSKRKKIVVEEDEFEIDEEILKELL